ncbi:hypothetical protein BXO88_10670 [Oribacterium sp. C9]|uniref:hypothetical protein n=1 Tax=Oribacterium sp. C9 TaxID=1943579 RepID=UPI00098F3CE0|nr:hypothetical protein [Oribacterium sp. C9]OON85714.1 hypothetical protein BXO88_10670 [Oribacterium sp. C9]
MLKIADFELLQDDYTDTLVERMQDDFAIEEEMEKGHCYEVTLQDIKFKCAYTDDEMTGIVRTCVAIIKELIAINANGYTKTKFNNFKSEGAKDALQQLSNINGLYNDYKTEKLEKLFAELTTYTRVGGAYLMLLAAPGFQQVINAVFERMLDDSDDENMWFSCLYFMIRGAMRMNSDDV